GLALLGPMIVGVVPRQYASSVTTLAVGATIGFLFAVLWMLSGSGSARSQMVVAVVASSLVSVALLDVAARPLFLRSLSPGEIVELPSMPLVHRYLPDVRFRGTIYGEMAKDPDAERHREYRDGSFATDGFGFRNERTPDGPIDVIVLGDSYAMGDDTAQSKTWPVLLSNMHGLRVYNLAIGGNGPWHEFTD